MSSDEKTLPIDLDEFGFVEREKRKGKPIVFRCGRDFLYYSLAYYKSEIFNPSGISPALIEKRGIFGLRIPWWMMWSALQFNKVPKIFKKYNLYLAINDKQIRHYFDFLFAFLFPKKISAQYAISVVEANVNKGEVSGIDISISLFGLVDHVLFVYGYDDENLFVFDTHKLPKLEYEKLTKDGDNKFIMKLPKAVIYKRWSRWGRVWTVTPTK